MTNTLPNLPTTGKLPIKFAEFDIAMKSFMDKAKTFAGSLAITKNGKLLVERGYGYADSKKTKKISPHVVMRIASLTKPITAAAIKKLISDKKLSLDTKVFPLLDLKPSVGKTYNTELDKITISHLLDHKGGWDKEEEFDPVFEHIKIAKALKLTRTIRAEDVVLYMLSQPLQFSPGKKVAYSNFGYCVLGRVIEKITKKSYQDYIQAEILHPLGITTIKVGHTPKTQASRNEIWYEKSDWKEDSVYNPYKGTFILEVLDSHGGLISSAADYCKFMEKYCLTGELRIKHPNSYYTFFGSLPGTKTIALQRPEGINLVILLNKRDKDKPSRLEDTMNKAIDSIGVSNF